MFKTKFIFIRVKSMILPACLCLFTVFLIVFSRDNLVAAKSGMNLWINSVLPSLLPFFIATELLGYTNIVQLLGKLLNPIMRPIFNVPGEGAFALLMGIISGYPMGAKVVSNLKSQGLCSPVECERLIAFTNNSGPLFIIGTVGTSLLGNSRIGILLFVSHILACLTVGFLFRWWKKEKKSRFDASDSNLGATNQNLSFENLGEILSRSISSAISLVVTIGGFIILFSVILSMLDNSFILDIFSKITEPLINLFGIPDSFSLGICSGILEVTNGLQTVASTFCTNLNMKIIICSFLLGFGGFSVMLQVLSITSKNKIPIKSYFIGKVLHAIISCLYTSILLNFMNF